MRGRRCSSASCTDAHQRTSPARWTCADRQPGPVLPAAAEGQVAPDLAGIAERSSLAGRLENTPTRMIRWFRHRQAIVPENVMPEPGIPEQEAGDMATYLNPLR